MKKVIALVAFVSDPYHALLFKKSYETYWKDEVDELRVQVNGQIPEVNKFIGSIYENSDVFQDSLSQGAAFDRIYPKGGDVLLTFCSDNYIMRKGVLSPYIEKIKSGEFDAVGSSGLHAEPKTADVIAEKLGLVRLNPFMSFWNKKQLDTIDLTFDSVFWEVGDNYKIPELDLMIEWGGHLDIMALMSIKYLTKFPKRLIIEPTNLPYYHHVCGLSSGVIHHFIKDGKTFYGKEDKKTKVDIGYLNWHMFAYEETHKDCPLEKFNRDYYEAMVKKIEFSGYTEGEVKEAANVVREAWI